MGSRVTTRSLTLDAPSSPGRAGRSVPIGIAPPPAPSFDFVSAKVQVPVPRAGSILRTALVNRLRGAAPVPLVTLVAPAGFGKTTLLAQWASRDRRPFAWVSIDERDNDPIVFLTHLAAALDTLHPVDSSVVDALRSPAPSIWTEAVPRLGATLAATREPIVLVLDNVDILRPGDSAGAVATLIEHLTEGSAVVLAGRAQPHLPIAALRAGGRLLEVGPEMLALSRREAQLLLRETGIELTDADVAELLSRSEGWAAGLYLATLALQDENGGPREVMDIGGDDRYLADYFRSEYLAQLSPKQLAFLRRTSVLDRMCGPLCDAVLERQDSATELESLDRANLFVVPLDHHRGWYRYHRLFKDLLRRELEQHEAHLIPELNRRAADWFEARGDAEAALEPAAASGDTDRVARLVTSLVLPVYQSGRIGVAEGWLERFDAAELDAYPAVAVLGAWVHALRGRPVEAERWLSAAEGGSFEGTLPDGSTSVRPWIALVRAALCRDGVEQMLTDAEAALSELPAESEWRPTALLLQGAALVLLGNDRRGDAVLASAADAAESVDATATQVTAISERAVVAAHRNDHAAAESLALEARSLVANSRVEGHAAGALESATSARALLRHSRWAEARAELESAGSLTPFLSHALPWLAVQARLELARAHVTLRDEAAARAMVSEAGEILRRRPRLGGLFDETDELQRQIDAMPDAEPGKGSGLTGAELRLLPLLATHLSFREIGERLFVSRNTVKTQAISLYRKLGVCSRSDAIERATRLGLVEATTGAPPTDLVGTG